MPRVWGAGDEGGVASGSGGRAGEGGVASGSGAGEGGVASESGEAWPQSPGGWL